MTESLMSYSRLIIKNAIMEQNQYILIFAFIIAMYFLFDWLNRKYFAKSRYGTAIRYFFLPFLFLAFFLKKALVEIKNGEYISICFLLFMILYFGYKFLKEMKRIVKN